jgi:hypothetical protein
MYDMVFKAVAELTISCPSPTSLVLDYMYPAWYNTRKALEELDPSEAIRTRDMYTLWSEFGEQFGMSLYEPDEAQCFYRQKMDAKATLQNQGRIGCSWHRCVAHKQDLGSRMMALQEIDGCGLVQYCGRKLKRSRSMECRS